MPNKFETKYASYASCLALALGLAFASVSPARADNFSGTWTGQAPAAGDCGILTVILVVSGETLSGTVSGKNGNPPIRPVRLPPSGVVSIDYARFSGSIRFSGNRFTGQFASFCGIRQVVGTKSS
jgi:hypothetical protein